MTLESILQELDIDIESGDHLEDGKSFLMSDKNIVDEEEDREEEAESEVN